jgi:hypothetical protein
MATLSLLPLLLRFRPANSLRMDLARDGALLTS